MTTTTPTAFLLFRLAVIAGAIFAAVSSEALPTGLLPEMSAELGVSEAQIGFLVTVFAGTVVVSTTPLALLTRRFSRKGLMVLLLSFFAVTNLMCAMAPSYEFLVVARVLGGLAHGLFWAVTGPYTVRIAPKGQLARAVAVTSAGGTAAMVLGVPLGTFLGHLFGWRLSFAAMAVIVLVFAAIVLVKLPAVASFVPSVKTGEIPLPTHKDRTLRAVWVVGITIIFVVTGQNIFFTYIAPWSIQVGGVGEQWVGGLLFAYGAAGAIGILLGGMFGDRFPRGAVNAAIAGGLTSVLFLWAFGHSALPVVVGLVAWAVCSGGVPSLLRTRLLHAVSDRIQDLASASLTTSFNIAIGGGALIGGRLLDAFGLVWLPLVGATVMASGLVFAILTDRVWIGFRR